MLRLCDPDGHSIEIGETMAVAVRRHDERGWPPDRICEKTGMPAAYVERVLRESC